MSACRDCLGCGLDVDAQGRMFVVVEPLGGLLCDPVDGLRLNTDDVTLVQTGGRLSSPVHRTEWIVATKATEVATPVRHFQYKVDATAVAPWGGAVQFGDVGGFAAGVGLGTPGALTMPAGLAGRYDIVLGILWSGGEVSTGVVQGTVGLRIANSAAGGWAPSTGRPGGSFSTTVRDYQSAFTHGPNVVTGSFSSVRIAAGELLLPTAITTDTSLSPTWGFIKMRKVGE